MFDGLDRHGSGGGCCQTSAFNLSLHHPDMVGGKRTEEIKCLALLLVIITADCMFVVSILGKCHGRSCGKRRSRRMNLNVCGIIVNRLFTYF